MIKTEFFEQLNENQRAATLNDICSCTKITAGAGCGKTKVISSRFLKLSLDLIEAGVEAPLEKILVITFTDKAANEMKERIYGDLKNAEIDYYSQSLWISTFHGFCSKILRKHSIEAGLAPNFKLGDEVTLKEIYDEIIAKIKNGQLGVSAPPAAAGDLNEIFEDIFGVIGKIKSLGISPEEFLDAATEATKGFSRMISSLPIENWEQYLKDFADDSVDFEEAFKEVASKKLVINKNGSPKPEKWTYADGFKEHAAEIERTELDLTRVIAQIYELYDSELLSRSIIDFDDLINKTIAIFKNNPEIRAHYQNCFKHIIIDEFQDTNGAQLELIKLLLDESRANITFVGDRKQSIYAFRHAQSENLEILHQYIKEKYRTNYPEIPLNINYRSMPEVLDAVNRLTGEHLKLDEKLHPAREGQGIVVTTVLEDVEDAADLRVKQAEFITGEIARLKESVSRCGSRRDERSTTSTTQAMCDEVAQEQERPKYSDFAVLVNSHSEAEFIEKFLLRAGIPSVKKDNTGFFKSPTARNLTALFRLAHNKNDEQALVRALKITLGDREIYEIAKNLPLEKGGESWKAAPEYLDGSIKRGEKLTSIFRKLTANYSVKKGDNYAKYRNQLDLRTFEKIVENYENTYQNTYLGDFIKYLERIEKDRDFELPNVAMQGFDAVNISTIHAAKGLEYDYVFVAAITSKAARSERGSIIFDLAYGKRKPVRSGAAGGEPDRSADTTMAMCDKVAQEQNKRGVGVVINKFKGKDTPKAALYKEIWKKPRERAEKLRLFYVAISRAKKYLNIISFEPTKRLKPAEYLDIAP